MHRGVLLLIALPLLAIASTPQDFVGKWRLSDSENFDAYMTTVGIGWLTRKLGGAATPVLTITVNGNHWTMLSESTFKTHMTEFDLGKEYEETTPDGRTMKSKFWMENGKLMQSQKPIKSEDVETKFTRSVEGSKHIIIMEANGVVAKRIYDKIVE